MANAFKKRSKKLEVGRHMPPLYHKLPGEDYDVRKSPAVKWLIKNPAILEFVWDQFKQSSDVIYDADSGKWIGVDWEGDEE